MENQSLLIRLLELEQELHLNSTRKNRERMETLLDPDFKELGRSGRSFSRKEILDEIAMESSLPEILVSEASVTTLSDDLVLLTYQSRHNKTGAERPTWRASLWRRDSSSWRICFHQGTPIEE